jgi:RNA polymerase sigma-70 factor (ECF subfamily)
MAYMGGLAVLRGHFGFNPNLFQAQSRLPRLIDAEVFLLESILFHERALPRIHKESILLAVAAARRSVYCVTLHAQMLGLLGVPEEKVDDIIADYRLAGLLPSTTALLDFALDFSRPVDLDPARKAEAALAAALGDFLCELARELGPAPDFPAREIPALAPIVKRSGGTPGFEHPGELAAGFALSVLNATIHLTEDQKHRLGMGQVMDRAAFTPEQNLEAAVLAALRAFLSAIQDFQAPKKVHPSAAEPRQIDVTLPADPDSEYVVRVRRGDADAFEELMTRHGQRVYRTLIGILGDPDEARDAMQDTFLKAFQNLAGFEGRSKFSTWLVSIASNTGIQRLRERRPTETLDEGEVSEPFQPRQVQAWAEDPEKLYSRGETRLLVERGVMRLPVKYRAVLMLRDIEQLPIEDAAAALGLSVSAAKTRLLRGRLMLRETLAPHFAYGTMKGVTH